MSLQICVSDQAKVNILEIWTYVAEDDPDAAESVIKRIWDKIEFLADSPKAGRVRDKLRLGIRSYPVGPYLIFYGSSDISIDILRIVHGGRNLEAFFETETIDTFRMHDT